MRVIILGADGMLGHELVQAFSEPAYDFYELFMPSLREVDITNYNDIHSYALKVHPDVIINAAAYTDVDGAESPEGREIAFAVNFEGVKNMANVAVEEKIILVHYSTDYVFSGEAADGYDENTKPGPAVNAYGESKLAGEEALRRLNPTHYLIRTAWLYGSHGKNFVETMLRLGQENKELAVIDDQFGSPTSAKDVAEATRTLLTKVYEPQTYHVVNSGRATWRTFAEEIFALAQMKTTVRSITTEDYPLPAKRPLCSVLNNTRGPTMRPWQEALADYLQSRTVT